MTYVREVTKLTIKTLACIDYFLSIIRISLHGVVDLVVHYEPVRPVFKSQVVHLFIYFFCLFIFFYVFCHYYYSANLQIQHYCLYSVSPTLLLLMMPRPPAPSAL